MVGWFVELVGCLRDVLLGCLIDWIWLIWLFVRLIHWLIRFVWFIDLLNNWLDYWFVGCLVCWLIGWLIAFLIGWLRVGLIGWLFDWMIVCFFLVDLLIDCLLAWFVGWLSWNDWSNIYFIYWVDPMLLIAWLACSLLDLFDLFDWLINCFWSTDPNDWFDCRMCCLIVFSMYCLIGFMFWLKDLLVGGFGKFD